MLEKLNIELLRLTRRADGVDRDRLVESFVELGALETLLASTDHQILFGRRGTGKTHALIYAADSFEQNGDLALFLDLRTIGSSSGLYSDSRASLAERGTRLILDVLHSIHDQLIEKAIDILNSQELRTFETQIDQLAHATQDVEVQGEYAQSQRVVSQSSQEATVGIQGNRPQGNLRFDRGQSEEHGTEIRGQLQPRVVFGAVSQAFQRVVQNLAPRRVWLLLDEWSSIPTDLQPILADLIRRSLLPHRGITVKIAAIEQRSSFMWRGEQSDYLGIELGADVSADLYLDDFMVYEHDANRAAEFFKELIARHLRTVARDPEIIALAGDPNKLINQIFTRWDAFIEFVMAAEGVPRDAINILSIAAQRSRDEKISIPRIREAARDWYHRDKESAVRSNESAAALLHWAVDEVIAHRKARAFLLRADVRDPLISELFDSRVLHVLKRGVSSHDEPGVRYDAFKIDYGAYVDLLNTVRAPVSLFPDDAPAMEDVPQVDYRAIRRAILELEPFYLSTQSQGNDSNPQ